MRTTPTALVFLIAFLACNDAKVVGPAAEPGRAGGTGSGGAIAPPPVLPSTDGPGFDLATGQSDPENVTPPPMTCAEQTQKAVQAPLDLVLVIDASSSMAGNAGATSKYSQVRQALVEFVGAPASAGLGLGLTFFPQPGSGSTCQNDADCGYLNAPTPPPCQPTSVCAKSLQGDGPLRFCGAARTGNCAPDDQCLPLGRCAVSHDDCANVGQACPGGRAGDTCVAIGKTCDFTDNQSCDPAAYAALAVPVVPLPDPGRRLVTRAFARRGASGATPMRPAIDGALIALRKQLGAAPDHKGALVLATDGAPFGCAGNTIPQIAEVLAAARAATPSIPTYVIGVSTPNDAMERAILGQLATAGGTGMPFIISATENLAQRFLETLATIRGQALPCEFIIPKATPGAGAIDYFRVNLRWQARGMQEDVLYAGGAARCDATRGGWYYDVDPMMGTPTRIILCEATCRKLKGQNDATVDLKFGCMTRTID